MPIEIFHTPKGKNSFFERYMKKKSNVIVAVDYAKSVDFTTIGTSKDPFIAALPHGFALTQEKFDKIFAAFTLKGSALTAQEVGELFADEVFWGKSVIEILEDQQRERNQYFKNRRDAIDKNRP